MTKKIRREDLILLATVHSPIAEIAATLDCSITTIENRIREMFHMTPGEFIEHYRAVGRVTLRKKGYSMALKGDWKALKFHLQNHVGMTDKVDTTHRNPDGTALNLAPQTVIILPAKDVLEEE